MGAVTVNCQSSEGSPGPWGSEGPTPPHQESQEQGLQQKLLDERFAVLRGAAAEAEAILQDAVSKLDDPLHLRCTSSPGLCFRHLPLCAHLPVTSSPTAWAEKPWLRCLSSLLADYLVSRAQAALDSVSGLEKGHAQYLASSEGEYGWGWCESAVSVGSLQLEAPGVGFPRRLHRAAPQSLVPVTWLTLVICRSGGQGIWSHPDSAWWLTCCLLAFSAPPVFICWGAGALAQTH